MMQSRRGKRLLERTTIDTVSETEGSVAAEVVGRELAKGTASAPRFIDAARLDTIVATLREIERRSGIERTLAVGELVLTQFFAGDPLLFRDRRRNKNCSIRRLAARTDCPFSKSALNEAVAVCIAARELACVRTFGHIGASHVASVLSLPSEQQREMLEAAEFERLSVRELRRRVVGVRRASGERRGRPALDAASHALKDVECDARRLAESVGRLRAFAPLDGALAEHVFEIEAMLGTATAELAACASDARPGVSRASCTKLSARTG
jgi:hypothetical protein